MDEKRKRRHLSDGGRVFIPQWRMRQIRWEEAVVRAKANRDGDKDVTIGHYTCNCGSIECIGTAMSTHWTKR